MPNGQRIVIVLAWAGWMVELTLVDAWQLGGFRNAMSEARRSSAPSLGSIRCGPCHLTTNHRRQSTSPLHLLTCAGGAGQGGTTRRRLDRAKRSAYTAAPAAQDRPDLLVTGSERRGGPDSASLALSATAPFLLETSRSPVASTRKPGF